jgi:hypothetical protein
LESNSVAALCPKSYTGLHPSKNIRCGPAKPAAYQSGSLSQNRVDPAQFHH